MEFDITIVGAGPTGILAAYKLLSLGFKVALVESGNWKSEGFLSRERYRFSTPSKIPEGVHMVGGGSNLWHGRVSQFPRDCFDRKTHTGERIWPLSFDVINSRYAELATLLNFRQIESDDQSLQKVHSCERCIDSVKKSLYQFIKPDTFRELLASFSSHPNFYLYTDTFVDKITAYPQNSVKLSCTEYVGHARHFNVESKLLVLAGGCMQSTALVRRSFDNLYKNKPVGNYLMEHFDGYIGTLKIRKENFDCLSSLALDDSHRLKSNNFGLGVTSISNAQLAWHLEIRPPFRRFNFDPVANRFNLPTTLLKLLFNFERVLTFVPNRLLKKYYNLRDIRTYSLWLKGEESPNYSSGIHLADAFRLRYHHRISFCTVKTLKKEIYKFASNVKYNNLGKIRFDLHFRIPGFLNTGGNFHPMGTLRMHASEGFVVNPDFTLSGYDNIFCIDSSIFPSGAHQNPTAMALTLTLEAVDNISKRNSD